MTSNIQEPSSPRRSKWSSPVPRLVLPLVDNSLPSFPIVNKAIERVAGSPPTPRSPRPVSAPSPRQQPTADHHAIIEKLRKEIETSKQENWQTKQELVSSTAKLVEGISVLQAKFDHAKELNTKAVKRLKDRKVENERLVQDNQRLLAELEEYKEKKSIQTSKDVASFVDHATEIRARDNVIQSLYQENKDAKMIISSKDIEIVQLQRTSLFYKDQLDTIMKQAGRSAIQRVDDLKRMRIIQEFLRDVSNHSPIDDNVDCGSITMLKQLIVHHEEKASEYKTKYDGLINKP